MRAPQNQPAVLPLLMCWARKTLILLLLWLEDFQSCQGVVWLQTVQEAGGGRNREDLSNTLNLNVNFCRVCRRLQREVRCWDRCFASLDSLCLSPLRPQPQAGSFQSLSVDSTCLQNGFFPPMVTEGNCLEYVWDICYIKLKRCLSWLHCHICSSLCHKGKTGVGIEGASGSRNYLHCLVSMLPFLCKINRNVEGIMESKGSIYLVSPLASPSQEVTSSAVTLHTQ